MKKFFTFLNLIFLTIIVILILTNVLIYINTQKTIRDIFRISDISRIQTALAIFLSETNRYPEGSNLILGGITSQVLCLPKDFRSQKGFFSNETSCQGKILLNPVPTSSIVGSSYIYNLTQDKNELDSYNISFILEKGIGKEFFKGSYCATPEGIKQGECQI